ncbi:MAG: hypothetical protein ABIH72_01675 [archaeon]
MGKIKNLAAVLVCSALSMLPLKGHSEDFDYFKRYQETVKTPDDCAYFLDAVAYSHDLYMHNAEDYWQAPAKTAETMMEDCDGMAILAAGVLADNDYPPLILDMEPYKRDGENLVNDAQGTRKYGHAVFIYKESEKWRYVDRLKNSKPFDTISDLVKSFNEYKSYKLINLDDLGIDWVNYQGNLRDCIPNYSSDFVNID